MSTVVAAIVGRVASPAFILLLNFGEGANGK